MLLKLLVIVEFKLFIKFVLDEILLIFVFIKLELELMLLKLVDIVEFKLLIKFVFDEILLKFVFEVTVRLPIKNVFELILFDNTLTSVLLYD